MKNFLIKYSEKPKGLFKTILIVFLFGYIPFMILHIILNALHIVPVNFNNEEVYGFKGVLIIICFTPLIVIMFTIMTWVYYTIGVLFIRLLKKIFYA